MIVLVEVRTSPPGGQDCTGAYRYCGRGTGQDSRRSRRANLDVCCVGKEGTRRVRTHRTLWCSPLSSRGTCDVHTGFRVQDPQGLPGSDGSRDPPTYASTGVTRASHVLRERYVFRLVRGPRTVRGLRPFSGKRARVGTPPVSGFAGRGLHDPKSHRENGKIRWGYFSLV